MQRDSNASGSEAALGKWLLLCGGVALAQKPARNVKPARHPNIAATAAPADQKVTAARAASEWEMDGLAAKAKELLDPVNNDNELKAAAEAANQHQGLEARVC
jgi:hypothetical protein